MDYTRRLVIAWNAESPRFRFWLTTEGLTIAYRFLLFFLLHSGNTMTSKELSPEKKYLIRLVQSRFEWLTRAGTSSY
jgi:hypothetical protein